jgi:hypothetical protein
MSTPSPTPSYHTQHAPRGASAHFTLGHFGSGGGFGLEQERVAAHDLFIGYRTGDAVRCLPFFSEAGALIPESFNAAQAADGQLRLVPIPAEEIQRTLGWGIDSWEAPGIRLAIATPVDGLPDPATAPASRLKDAVAPAVTLRLTLDNRAGTHPIQGVFGVGGLRGLRLLSDETGGELLGAASIDGYGFACAATPGIQAWADFNLMSLYGRPHPIPFRLAAMGCLLIDVPAGEATTINIVLGWHHAGIVTRGAHECAYYYTRYFANLAEVLRYGLAHAATWWAHAEAADRELAASGLSPDQQFLIAQATRSYWASSMLFDDGGRPRWAVNEGTFLMLNTFDLAVDHLFFELRQHPWVVRNVLDAFADEYSYVDEVHFPEAPDVRYPGGVSFTHDQGVCNTFSPHGYSSYEVTDQEGCFSYMTQEQLVNWLVCAALYVGETDDRAWLLRRRALLADCLTSMLNRDHPNPALRDGIMGLDSSRCGREGEITTYDSLDPSLGQARRNLYLAVKGWAAYLSLAWLFRRTADLHLEELAVEAEAGALRCAQTVAAAYNPQLGFIPAILDGVDTSPIIPAIEGLVFPERLGWHEAIAPDGPYGAMIGALRAHLTHILTPELCLFADGGWQLSANSENSWISKIFLCQYIARRVLGVAQDEAMTRADRAHAHWWQVGCATDPGIDQIFAGQVREVGFFYPRGVTNILWLDETTF